MEDNTVINFDRSINLNINKVKAKSNNKKKKMEKYNKPGLKKERSVEDIKKQVSNAINKVGGKYVKFDNIDHTEGLMVCGVLFDSVLDDISNEKKVCFAVMNRDKKIVYISSNEHFSILSNVPASLYVLNYLNTREPDTLLSYAEDAFDKDKVNVFTNICIKSRQNNQVKKKK